MDILTTFLQHRQQAALLADYSQYRKHCTRRLEKLRKRLGVANTRKGKNAKFVAKAPVGGDDVGRDPSLAQLHILASEKAWADAQYMKSMKDTTPLDASAKKYIKSRLHKASARAVDLRTVISDPAANASDRDLLEAAFFAFQAIGAESMEKHTWAKGLPAFAAARLILTIFIKKYDEKKCKEFLTGVVEPSLRYSAYNLGIGRSVELDVIMRDHFPKEDTTLVDLVNRIYPEAFQEQAAVEQATQAVKEVEWRGRKAPVEVADVASALGNVKTAEKELETYLATHQSLSGKDQAAAFDGILSAWQDAQDTTKEAISDLQAEKVAAADPRIQALQIAFTYVSYNLIGWRIARDRTMSEGIVENAKGGKLSGLKELVALYDAILRSFDQIAQLPGVAMDRPFMAEIKAKKGYFQALKCLAIAKSHALLDRRRNALALLSRASTHLSTSLPALPTPTSTSTISGLDVSPTEAQALSTRLASETLRFRALAEIEKLSTQAQSSTPGTQTSVPLIDRIEIFSEGDVDVKNIVRIPPAVEPIPVKPIFFDIAWNYIEYPGGSAKAVPQQAKGESKEEGKKRGLFGLFGR